ALRISRSLLHKLRSGLPLCGCASGTTHTRVGGVSRCKAAFYANSIRLVEATRMDYFASQHR
ncbi:MAG: hypothetical protein LBF83_07085, partial [Spirochaetaceae bacterium]|nr:hypothetical protein [Spirochaetaceae bacterium]